ncbi:MAG: glycosyltransferase family A protein [Actinomycetota bacterium]|nr:glycosyltransferase family A protein [Actinomycetota bacterium]
MKIATIVVTKGRSAYLSELLASLEPQLDEQSPVLIVDNASSDNTPAVIHEWLARQQTPVHSLRVEVNVPDARQWIDAAREQFDCDWVTFPGDDDRYLPGHLADLRVAIASTPGAVCVAAGIQDMDPQGVMQAGVSIPSAGSSRAALIGRLFARPEFSWPAFAFRSSVLDGALPQLRFTFDWWVQLNCVLSGPAAYTGRATIAYRRHPQQESYMWSTRRKYAEAAWMLNSVVIGPRFAAFQQESESTALEVLLDAMVQAGGPVYGDPVFGLPISISTVSALYGADVPVEALLPAMRQSAAALGLTPTDAVLATWLGMPAAPAESMAAGAELSVEASRDLCARSIAIARAGRITPVSSSRPTLLCEHQKTPSGSRARGIVIACSSASTDEILASGVRDQVEAQLEDSASITSGLQPMERKVLAAYRTTSKRVPHRLRAMLKRKAS